MSTTKDLARIVRAIEEAQTQVNREILATPTGEVRNLICDANVYLEAAKNSLQRAWLKEAP